MITLSEEELIDVMSRNENSFSESDSESSENTEMIALSEEEVVKVISSSKNRPSLSEFDFDEVTDSNKNNLPEEQIWRKLI